MWNIKQTLDVYKKDAVKELDEDNLGKLVGSVREVANDFGGIAEMSILNYKRKYIDEY